MHVHLFLNGKIIYPWHHGPCHRAGLTRFVHSGRWLDLAVFR